MSKNILIYDSNSSTHLHEFVEYIIDYFNGTGLSNNQYVLLLNKKIYSKIENRIENDQLKVVSISNSNQNVFDSQRNMLYRTFKEKYFLESILEEYKIDHIIFLDIDAFVFVIGFWRFGKTRNLKISGILLSPFSQLPISNIATFIKYYRKRFQLTVMSLNINITSIFIFNDVRSVIYLNNLVGLSKLFKYLPDPIKIREYKKINIREKYYIDENTKVFLSIGGISRRKNLLKIIEAFNNIDENYTNKVCLLILGHTHDLILLDEIKLLLSQKRNSKIVFDNCFLTNEEFESAIEDSDALFVLYSYFYSSSGIIGNAAKHGKYIIATKNGVIGDVIRKYEIGVTIDEGSVPEITKAINCFCSNGSTASNNEFILKEHHYLTFVSTLLGV